jgi:hypothetical protein
MRARLTRVACVALAGVVALCVTHAALANPTRVASRSTNAATSTSTARASTSAVLILDSGIAAPLIAVSCNDRLRAAYTGALIRVRRSSDNAEADIGYTAGNVLDRTALTAHCGVVDCFVTTEYDQSGNGRNMTQTTAANQPQIVTTGTINVSGGNVVMTNIAANGSDGLTRADAGGLTGNHDLTMFWLGFSTTIPGTTAMQRIGDSAGYTLAHSGADIDTTWGSNPGDNIWTTSSGTAYRYVITSYSSSTNGDAVYENGVTLSHTTYATAAIVLADTQYRTGYAFCAASWSTDMVWNSILSSGDRITLNAWAEIRRTS